jgi:hypothetical protein
LKKEIIMKSIFRNTLLTALLCVVLPTQAAIQQYSFNGAMDSGYYNGEAFSGNFSFDDAGYTGSGLELFNLDTLNMSFLNATFTQANAALTTTPDVAFQDGAFLGLEWTVEQPQLQFTFVAGLFDVSDAFIAYDTPIGTSGAGSVIYAPVPEPETYAMLLAGLGMLGATVQRRNRKNK